MQELLFPEIVKYHADPVFTDFFITETVQIGITPIEGYTFIAICPMKNGKPYFITGTRIPDDTGGWVTGSVRMFKANRNLAWDDYNNRERM